MRASPTLSALFYLCIDTWGGSLWTYFVDYEVSPDHISWHPLFANPIHHFLDCGSSSSSPIIPNLKLSSSVWPACWQKSFCPTWSGGSCLFLAVFSLQRESHGHKNGIPAANASCANSYCPPGSVYCSSSLSSSLVRSRRLLRALSCFLGFFQKMK